MLCETTDGGPYGGLSFPLWVRLAHGATWTPLPWPGSDSGNGQARGIFFSPPSNMVNKMGNQNPETQSAQGPVFKN